MKIEEAQKAAHEIIDGATFDASSRDYKMVIAVLVKDSERMSWLADINNIHGAVSLPKACVERNMHSMRDAIDDAKSLAEDHPSIYEDEHERQVEE